MTDPDRDPAANTDMFRAYAAREEPPPPRGSTFTPVVIGGLIAVGVVLVLVLAVATLMQ